ncbi:MAG TPA: hypothetical protein VND92_00405, partial [Vicinamibacterales bacterium]|nr:hypothetical protein [Vicinamibacterales bacterium]
EGNAALGPALNEPVRVFRQRVTAAIDLVNAHLNVPPGQAAMPDGLAPALQKVLDAGFVLERTSLPTLDGLLRSRAEATRHDRDHTLKIVLALLAAGLLLGAGAMWSFTRRLRHAAQAIGAADVGQTEALEKEAGGDEVGDVVGAAAGLLRRLGSAAGARPASAASGHETPPAESLADENHQLKLLVAELSLANRFGQEDA